MKLKKDDHIEAGDVIAIGDIHARLDVFEATIERLRGSGARVVQLGDMIDRGGEDLKVLALAKEVYDDPERFGLESFTVLRGNHEDMFLKARAGSAYASGEWWSNGGNLAQLQEMSRKFGDWVESLPVFVTIGEFLFVHGGLIPGEDPKESDPYELVWTREPFLTEGGLLNRWSNTLTRVIHGHTIESFKHPVEHKDRVGIDTAAFHTGILTSYNATRHTYWQTDLNTKKMRRLMYG